MKNTYIQEKKYKDYKFSEGEDLTEMDLEVIASRSRKTYQTDKAYENYLSENYSSTIFVKFDDNGELDDEENRFYD